jgi:hypothetical protein
VRDILLGVLAFALTWVEVVVCTKGARADRQSTYCKTSRKSNEAAVYEGLHEAIIIAYTVLVVKEALWLALPVITAAVLSRRWTLERRRRKFRRRPRKPKLDNPTVS